MAVSNIGGREPQPSAQQRNSGKNRTEEVRMNRRIRVPEVRVIDAEGEQLGVMPTAQALRQAEEQGLDLVEIQPNARPPVCKIMDHGKYKYEQSRKLAESKKKQQQIELKEVKFRPQTDTHDFLVKVNNLKRFLEKGNKGKVSVVFRGREIVHLNVGREMLTNVIAELGDTAIIEQPPRLEGRHMVMIVAPAKQSVKKS